MVNENDILNERYATVIDLRRPSALWKPKLSIDGDKWCALYGENLQDGVAGFGDSPELAMWDFDRAWVEKLPPVKSNKPAAAVEGREPVSFGDAMNMVYEGRKADAAKAVEGRCLVHTVDRNQRCTKCGKSSREIAMEAAKGVGQRITSDEAAPPAETKWVPMLDEANHDWVLSLKACLATREQAEAAARDIQAMRAMERHKMWINTDRMAGSSKGSVAMCYQDGEYFRSDSYDSWTDAILSLAAQLEASTAKETK